MKILMVCLGNICRSPLAEGILRKKIEQHQLPWSVDSAGTGAYHVGQQADPRSRDVARQHGLDISDQRARQLQAKDLDEFDLLFAMDHSNERNIRALAKQPKQKEKIHLILEFTGADLTDVPDPYWDDNGFEQVYQMLDQACDKLVTIVQQQNGSSSGT
jgi:protein-tyrosine phosphatase